MGWVISIVIETGMLSQESSGVKLIGSPTTWLGEITMLSGNSALHPEGTPLSDIVNIAKSLPVFSTQAVGKLCMEELTIQSPFEYNSMLGDVPTLTGISCIVWPEPSPSETLSLNTPTSPATE